MSRKGISLVALVVTVVVLIILTGIVLINAGDKEGVIQESQEVVNQVNKGNIIDKIKEEVVLKQIEKQTIEHKKFTLEDIVLIISKYGEYNESTLELITNDNIKIKLYEIMLLPIEEYVEVKNVNGGITIETTLSSQLGSVRYSIDNGINWIEYTVGQSINAEKIIIQLVDMQANQMSDRMEINGNSTMSIVDQRAPIIVIPPIEKEVMKSAEISITVLDSGGLDSNNIYEYYLSTSKETQLDGEWIKYENGKPITIGTGLNGKYYIHVKPVKDKSNNQSEHYVSEAYNFDNEKPIISVNISEVNRMHNMQIDVSDNVGVNLKKCKYVLKQTNIPLGTTGSNYTDGVLLNENSEIQAGICGQYYLHVIATDIAGNTNTYVSNIIEGTNTGYGSLASEDKYSYTGSIQSVSLSAGIYKLEVWGAAGGSDGTAGTGGKGGYSSGMLFLSNANNVHIGVGGVGTSSASGAGGGYNGGGNAGNSGSSGAGGGATHIAIQTNRGVLSEYENYKNEVLIVAGAGGGGGNSYQTINGGYGGGATRGVPGGANAGDYAFGRGQARSGDGGGGGSGWYGGYASNGDGGGAGGIGYINPILKNAQTVEGNVSFASLDGGTETGHAGNGCAKITQYLPGYQYVE